MTTFNSMYELTTEGLYLFQRAMTGGLAASAIESANTAHARPLPGSKPFEVKPFSSAKEMAAAICHSLGSNPPQKMAGNIGLWAWLTLMLADVLFQKKDGQWAVKEVHRWYPAAPGDYQKAQRHLVRMPVLLYSALGTNADHLLCNKPSVLPEIREQLTSQQDMFSANFQEACRTLYFDDATGGVKRGAAGKDGPGVVRRLAAVRQQLDVTWDMTDLSSSRILELLPPEFDLFKPSANAATAVPEMATG